LVSFWLVTQHQHSPNLMVEQEFTSMVKTHNKKINCIFFNLNSKKSV
jgi:hypothetical protein